MNIQQLQKLYADSPQVAKLAKMIGKNGVKDVFLEGLLASSVPMVFSGLAKKVPATILFVLQDADEAGYFYHDLMQVMGNSSSPERGGAAHEAPHPEGEGGSVLFFPSSYRRAIKYGQKDAASEILRTEVLSVMRNEKGATSSCYIVTYPEALAEMVVTRKQLDSRMLTLEIGQKANDEELLQTLHEFGFQEVDYVYEPGQFALRGSILDIFSFSHEYPFRIDFFGDEIDSIRTFDVENQLSKERRSRVDVVPDLTASTTQERESLLKFLPDDTWLVFKDFDFVRETIERIYQEGFSSQAMTERLENATEVERYQIEHEMQRDSLIITGSQLVADAEPFRKMHLGASSSKGRQEGVSFHISPQPLYHKNFDLLVPALEDFLLKGYKLYVLADSQKQIDRLKDIFKEKSGLGFEGVKNTLHEGFVDNDLRICCFTDHQIFDRFHKYNLKSDKARSGKVALTLKEIQQFEVGDYIVHVDHGIGRFGGLVRMPISSPSGGGREGAFQEMIKITYQRGDCIYVSIHSLYKVSKYKSQENGEPPRLST